MGMRMSGSPRMAMRCPTCEQEIGGSVRDATANVNANLFGAEKYAVCPNCNQVVPEHMQTAAYKDRVKIGKANQEDGGEV